MYHVTPSKDAYKYIMRVWCIEIYLGCGQPIYLSSRAPRHHASKYEMAAKTTIKTWRK